MIAITYRLRNVTSSYSSDIRKRCEVAVPRSAISPAIWAVTCVIKTNPGEHFSVMSIISTMISLDAYETLIRQGGDLAPRVASPKGLDRKRIEHGN